MYNINRRKFLNLFGCSCCSLILPACSTVPITERRQLSIIPESKVNAQAAAAYEKFRSKAKIITEGSQLKEVIEIGKKIEVAVSAFFLSKGEEDPTQHFDWDYILVDNDKVVNAWCMPGGKIAVYTGLLKITKNTNALSIVMGHEIAHAVAKQETEADYLGLIFSSLSGYDIRESVKLWERMSEKNKGKEPPVFLSTHPSSKKRIENLKEWINEVIITYPPIKT